jgi:DNA-binding beta-propeller fold protein YncE
MLFRIFSVLIGLLSLPSVLFAEDSSVRRLLYVATPGIRNYLEFGGQGVLVFDIDKDHQFIKRIDTPAGKEKPENIKGICANAQTKRLYISTPAKLYCMDLVTEKNLWEKALPLGCDRMSITPDGKWLYVPSFEKETWNVVEAETGEVKEVIETKSGAHNTVCGLDGSWMYLAGLKSPHLSMADTKTHKVTKTVGPFSAAIRPFTVNGKQTLCFCCVNERLGFEIGDIGSGKVLHKIDVEGVKKGPVKRHGCPSHGIGLTPDEKEIWLCDAFNTALHVFDVSQLPPKQKESIKLREQPGWVTFSLDGKYTYSSTGEVIDTKTKKILVGLKDEKDREVHSEKVIEIHFQNQKPITVGDQFGLVRVK